VTLVQEDYPPGANAWIVSSTTASVVICGDTTNGYCTTPLEWTSGPAPSFNKSRSGFLVAGTTKTEGGPQMYRIVVAPRGH